MIISGPSKKIQFEYLNSLIQKKKEHCYLNSYFTSVFTEEERDLKSGNSFPTPTKKELDSVQITAEMVIKRLDTFKVVSLGNLYPCL